MFMYYDLPDGAYPVQKADIQFKNNLFICYMYIILLSVRAGILVQVTIYRRLLIGRDGNLDQSEAYNI